VISALDSISAVFVLEGKDGRGREAGNALPVEDAAEVRDGNAGAFFGTTASSTGGLGDSSFVVGSATSTVLEDKVVGFGIGAGGGFFVGPAAGANGEFAEIIAGFAGNTGAGFADAALDSNAAARDFTAEEEFV
jgi:hypothetical protein